MIYNVDLWEPFRGTISCVQGDTYRFLLFNIKQNKENYGLEGKTVKIFMKKPDGKKVVADMTIIDEGSGVVEVQLTSQMLAAIGEVNCTIRVYTRNQFISSRPFSFSVAEQDVADDDAVESTNEFSALTQMIGNVEQWNNKINAIKDSASTNIKEFGVYGTNIETDTANLEIALASGKDLLIDKDIEVKNTISSALFNAKFQVLNNACFIIDTYKFYPGNSSEKTTIYVSNSGDANVAGISKDKPTTIDSALLAIKRLYKIYGEFKGDMEISLLSGRLMSSNDYLIYLSNISTAAKLIFTGPDVALNSQPIAILDGNYDFIKSEFEKPLSVEYKKELNDSYRYKHTFYMRDIKGKVLIKNLWSDNVRVVNEINGNILDIPEAGGTRCGFVFMNHMDVELENVWASYCDWVGISAQNNSIIKVKGGNTNRCRIGWEALFSTTCTFGYGSRKGTGLEPDTSVCPTISECTDAGISIREGSSGHTDYCKLVDNYVGIFLLNATGNNFGGTKIDWTGKSTFVTTPFAGIRFSGCRGSSEDAIITGYPQSVVSENNGGKTFNKEYVQMSSGPSLSNYERNLSYQGIGWQHTSRKLNFDPDKILEHTLFIVEANSMKYSRTGFECDIVYRTTNNADTTAVIKIYGKQDTIYIPLAVIPVQKVSGHIFNRVNISASYYVTTLRSMFTNNANNGVETFNYIENTNTYDPTNDMDIVIKLEGATATQGVLYQYRINRLGM